MQKVDLKIELPQPADFSPVFTPEVFPIPKIKHDGSKWSASFQSEESQFFEEEEEDNLKMRKKYRAEDDGKKVSCESVNNNNNSNSNIHPATLTTLKLATYNVYFGPNGPSFPCNTDVIRWKGVLALLENLNADVVGLQEVTPTMLTLILDNPFIQRTYYISTMLASSVSPYGCVLLSRYEPVNAIWMTLPTQQSRYLVAMKLALGPNEVLSVGTVHLESVFDMRGPELRKNQLDLIYPELEKDSNVSVLMGDFNFVSYTAELGIPPHFVDVWSKLHPDDAGLTFDKVQNPKLIYHQDRHRVDRITVSCNDDNNSKNKGGVWAPRSIEIFGKEAIPEIDMPPSDHFGLVCELQRT